MTSQWSSTLLGPSVAEGRLSISGTGLQWSAKQTDKKIEVNAKALTSAKWYDLGPNNSALYVTDETGSLYRFAGLSSRDFEGVSTSLKGLSVAVTKGRISANGRSFGDIKVGDGGFDIVGDDGGVITTIPFSSIGVAAYPGRGEVEIQIAEDDTMDREDECLLEMRLYLPDGMKVAGVEPKAAASASAEGEDEEEEESTAQAFHRVLTGKVGTSGSVDTPLVSFPDEVGKFTVPRGRFAMELYPSHMRLISKAVEFKVAYKSIARITYLPAPNPTGNHETATQFAIVISLDDPLRHGQQRHPHLVLQLDRKPYEVALSIPTEDVAAGRYEGLGADGAQSAKAELPKLVGSLLKKITGKPVYKPESFLSANSQRAVRCSHKSNSGLLYFLDKSMMFIHKPTVWLKFADIEGVAVERFAGTGAGSARTFDIVVRIKGGAGESSKEFLFQGLDTAEHDPVTRFLKDKGLAVTDDSGGRKGGVNYAELDEGLEDDEDEEDEEDYNSDDAEKEERRAAASDGDEEDEGDSDASGGAGKKRKAKSSSKGKSKSSKKSKSKPSKKSKRKGSSDEDSEDSSDDDSDESD